MNKEKRKGVVSFYKKYFEKEGIFAIECNSLERDLLFIKRLAHCYSMLYKIEKFLEEEDIEKADRWLGFVQGCLWMQGIFSIDDLKNHNKYGVDFAIMKGQEEDHFFAKIYKNKKGSRFVKGKNFSFKRDKKTES